MGVGRSRITQALRSGLRSAPTIDSILQIRLFGKLKLTKCARPGNRAGLFRARLSVGWAERLREAQRFTRNKISWWVMRRSAPRPACAAIGGANPPYANRRRRNQGSPTGAFFM